MFAVTVGLSYKSHKSAFKIYSQTDSRQMQIN